MQNNILDYWYFACEFCSCRFKINKIFYQYVGIWKSQKINKKCAVDIHFFQKKKFILSLM